ncbi:MAG: PIN domain-containing protein [Gammaproteobacteria bacterium]|nr:PIN domain-containing protein [Gammaproteobacteria bacterium]
MRGWLIDTNVVSELRRARPARKVRAFVAGQPGDVLFTSDVTFAEFRFGIEQITDPTRRADLVQWLDRTLRPLFAGRVLAVTEDALLRWRLMLEVGRKKGHTFSEPDFLIAALAALADLIVVSRDVSEFIAAGVPVFDPWGWTLHSGGRADRIADADMADALAKAAELMAN